MKPRATLPRLQYRLLRARDLERTLLLSWTVQEAHLPNTEPFVRDGEVEPLERPHRPRPPHVLLHVEGGSGRPDTVPPHCWGDRQHPLWREEQTTVLPTGLRWFAACPKLEATCVGRPAWPSRVVSPSVFKTLQINEVFWTLMAKRPDLAKLAFRRTSPRASGPRRNHRRLSAAGSRLLLPPKWVLTVSPATRRNGARSPRSPFDLGANFCPVRPMDFSSQKREESVSSSVQVASSHHISSHLISSSPWDQTSSHLHTKPITPEDNTQHTHLLTLHTPMSPIGTKLHHEQN